MSATTSTIPSPNPTSVAWNNYLNNQSFNVTDLDGAPTTLTLSEIHAIMYTASAEAACAAFGVGFVSSLFIVLLLITPPTKIRKPIFLLNLVSMFLTVFLDICGIYVVCASYETIGLLLLGTWVPLRTFAVSILSLVLVRVVLAAEPRTQTIFTTIGAIVATVLIGFVTTWVVVLTRVILSESTYLPMWIYITYRIMFCCFIGIACLIFLYKLGLTIYRRLKMGMNINQFAPLQIIFIMFCQCLIVPLIFYICDLTVIGGSFNNFDSLGQVFLVGTLPLSALWASADARDHRAVKQTLGSDGSSSGHSRNKFVLWSPDKKSKDKISDIEKAPSYITDGTYANENVQLSYDSTLEESNQ